MSAASGGAASFVRRRHIWGAGSASRYCPWLFRRSPSSPSSSSVLRHHPSSAPAEIWPTTEEDHHHHQKKKKNPGNNNNLPWLMLSSPSEPQSRFLYRLSLDDHRFKLDRVLHLPEIAGSRCIGVSSQGHMLTVPARCSPNVVAINPLTGSRLPLPPTSALPDFQIDDKMLRNYKTFLEHEEQATADPNRFGLVNGRAILSPSLDTLVLSRLFSSETFFAHLSLSSSPSSWLPIFLPMFNMDFVFHKGQFFVVEYTGSIVSFKEFRAQPLIRPRDDAGCYEEPCSTHIVETPDGEELFLVHRKCPSRLRYGNRTRTFRVFRLDKNDKYTWKEVDSLGGLTFFVGANQSVSVLAADFPGLLSDSIYFTDDVPFGNFPSVLSETGVFNLRDGAFQFFQFADEEIQLNWPPPMWYGSIAC